MERMIPAAMRRARGMRALKRAVMRILAIVQMRVVMIVPIVRQFDLAEQWAGLRIIALKYGVYDINLATGK